MKSQYTNEIIPAEAAPRGWDKIEGDNNTVQVKFKLPFPASLGRENEQTPVMREAELTIHIPVGMFAIFTEECAKSTRDALGQKGGKRLLDAVAQDYYKGLILAKMTEKD